MERHQLYEKKQVERWWNIWRLAAYTGRSIDSFLPAQQRRNLCPDQCGMRPERWITKGSKRSPFKECKKCGRFIGYIRETKTKKRNK